MQEFAVWDFSEKREKWRKGREKRKLKAPKTLGAPGWLSILSVKHLTLD